MRSANWNSRVQRYECAHIFLTAEAFAQVAILSSASGS
jgi:hypothetical protein